MKITVKCHAEAGDRYPYFELEVRDKAKYHDVVSTLGECHGVLKITESLIGGDVWGGRVTLDRAALLNKSVNSAIASIIEEIKIDNQKALNAFPEEKIELNIVEG